MFDLPDPNRSRAQGQQILAACRLVPDMQQGQGITLHLRRYSEPKENGTLEEVELTMLQP